MNDYRPVLQMHDRGVTDCVFCSDRQSEPRRFSTMVAEGQPLDPDGGPNAKRIYVLPPGLLWCRNCGAIRLPGPGNGHAWFATLKGGYP